MAKRRQYDDKFRASAVVMLQAAGYPSKEGALSYVARHLGVPAMTLSRWFKRENNAPPNELVKQEKEALSIRLEALAHRLIDAALTRVDDDHASIQQVTVSLGIIVDKMQLLKGEPTERTEVVDNAARAERINAILDTARARRDGRAAESEYVQ